MMVSVEATQNVALMLVHWVTVATGRSMEDVCKDGEPSASVAAVTIQ